MSSFPLRSAPLPPALRCVPLEVSPDWTQAPKSQPAPALHAGLASVELSHPDLAVFVEAPPTLYFLLGGSGLGSPGCQSTFVSYVLNS